MHTPTSSPCAISLTPISFPVPISPPLTLMSSHSHLTRGYDWAPLSKSCVGNPSYHEFQWELASPCLESTFQASLPHSNPFLWLSVFFHPCFPDVSRALGSVIEHFPLLTEHPTVTCSQHLDQLYVSAVTATHYEREASLTTQIETLIYVHKHSSFVPSTLRAAASPARAHNLPFDQV